MSPARVLALLPSFIPSTLISVVKPLVALHQGGRVRARITLESFATERDLREAEVVVFCRNSEPGRSWLPAVRAAGKPYVYDLDDNLLDIPPDTAEGRHHQHPARRALLEDYLRGAALVRLYSKRLAERVRSLNPRIEVVRGSLDWSLIPGEPRPAKGSRVRIVYATSRLEDELSRLFLTDLREVLVMRPDRVEATLWGGAPPDMREHPNVRLLPLEPDYDAFLSRLARGGFDVGLAPLPGDPFHLCKTDNKFREYGACGIAGLYSDVEVYAGRVEDGVTGLLVPNERGAWRAALLRLVDAEEPRESIRRAAYAKARAEYSQERAAEEWGAQIERVRREGSPRGAARIEGAPALRPPTSGFAVWKRRLARLRGPELGTRLRVYSFNLRMLGRLRRALR